MSGHILDENFKKLRDTVSVFGLPIAVIMLSCIGSCSFQCIQAKNLEDMSQIYQHNNPEAWKAIEARRAEEANK